MRRSGQPVDEFIRLEWVRKVSSTVTYVFTKDDQQNDMTFKYFTIFFLQYNFN